MMNLLKSHIFTASCLASLVITGCESEPSADSEPGAEMTLSDMSAPDLTLATLGGALDASQSLTPDMGFEPPALGAPSVDVDARRPAAELSSLSLVMWSREAQRFVYGDQVIPYDISTPLFSDYTQKDRAVYVPPEGQVSVDPHGLLVLPHGSVTIKSFSYPSVDESEGRRVIETRLMFRGQQGWSAWPYVWDTERGEANLSLSGAVLPQADLPFLEDGEMFTYVVPQRNQCIDCHEVKTEEGREITPIGIKLRNLSPASFEEGGLIRALIDRGQLDEREVEEALQRSRPQVSWREVESRGVAQLAPDEVEVAARDYLDINCAHCHNPRGAEGVSSQLFLNWDAEDPFHLGVCKKPGSAGKGTFGFTYDIVPGSPESSILWLRMDTVLIGSMMPDFGRSLRDQTGVELIYRWIAQLEGTCEASE